MADKPNGNGKKAAVIISALSLLLSLLITGGGWLVAAGEVKGTVKTEIEGVKKEQTNLQTNLQKLDDKKVEKDVYQSDMTYIKESLKEIKTDLKEIKAKQ
jgi:hypothetical protein